MKQSMRLYVLLRLQNDKTCLFSRQNRNFLPIAGVHLVKQAERQRRQLPRAPKLNTQQRNTHQEFSAHFIGCIIFQLRVRPTIFFFSLCINKDTSRQCTRNTRIRLTADYMLLHEHPCTILVSNIFLLAVFFLHRSAGCCCCCKNVLLSISSDLMCIVVCEVVGGRFRLISYSFSFT